jgi:2-methylcitrate dehydratase PrpD
VALDSVDVVRELARNAVATIYDDLPAQAVLMAKVALIDTLGAMIAGTTAPGCEAVVDLAREWGGKGESTIIVHGDRVPAANAVMANSTMARARELDDSHHGSGQHPSVAAIPTALAMAERRGGASGREFITAVAVGADIQCRVVLPLRSKVGVAPWTTGMFAPFAAAATAGKMLNLDENKMLHALALAFTEASNTIQSHLDGSLAARIHHGMASKAGVVCALLAERGVTGPQNCLEGPAGFYAAFGRGEYDRERATFELGRRFEGAYSSPKRYSCCGQIHPTIVATLALVHEHDLNPEEIVEIVTHVNHNAYNQVCLPEDLCRNPRNHIDAQFSIPYAVAVAVTKKAVELESYTDESVKDPSVIAMANKVRCVMDPEIDKLGVVRSPGFVEIKTVSGQVYSKRVDHVKGDPEDPMTLEECTEEKFRKYLSWSALPLSESAVEEVIETVTQLEEVGDASRVMQLLSAK